MLSKTCPNCETITYSSSERNIWTCPKCKRDLKDVKTTIAKNNY